MNTMQQALMDEIPFGSPPHRAAAQNANHINGDATPPNILDPPPLPSSDPDSAAPYSDGKVQTWLAVNSPHFVLPPSPMATMDDDLSSEVSASNDSSSDHVNFASTGVVNGDTVNGSVPAINSGVVSGVLASVPPSDMRYLPNGVAYCPTSYPTGTIPRPVTSAGVVNYPFASTGNTHYAITSTGNTHYPISSSSTALHHVTSAGVANYPVTVAGSFTYPVTSAESGPHPITSAGDTSYPISSASTVNFLVTSTGPTHPVTSASATHPLTSAGAVPHAIVSEGPHSVTSAGNTHHPVPSAGNTSHPITSGGPLPVTSAGNTPQSGEIPVLHVGVCSPPGVGGTGYPVPDNGSSQNGLNNSIGGSSGIANGSGGNNVAEGVLVGGGCGGGSAKSGKHKKIIGTTVPGRPDMIIGEDGNPRPKKYQNSYMLFCRDHRSIVAKENPEATPIEVARILGQRWRDLSPETKRPYQDQARKDKDEWVAKYGDYKNLAGIPKRKLKTSGSSSGGCGGGSSAKKPAQNGSLTPGGHFAAQSNVQQQTTITVFPDQDRSCLESISPSSSSMPASSMPASSMPQNSMPDGWTNAGSHFSASRPTSPDASSTGISEKLSQFRVGRSAPSEAVSHSQPQWPAQGYPNAPSRPRSFDAQSIVSPPTHSGSPVFYPADRRPSGCPSGDPPGQSVSTGHSLPLPSTSHQTFSSLLPPVSAIPFHSPYNFPATAAAANPWGGGGGGVLPGISFGGVLGVGGGDGPDADYFKSQFAWSIPDPHVRQSSDASPTTPTTTTPEGGVNTTRPTPGAEVNSTPGHAHFLAPQQIAFYSGVENYYWGAEGIPPYGGGEFTE